MEVVSPEKVVESLIDDCKAESESKSESKSERVSDGVCKVPKIEGLSEEQIAGLTRLTMRLYCLPYSEEFRQPVQVKYPDLLETYMSIIRTPSDLGTILLKLKNKSYRTIEECAKELKLCFQNAIQFNADLSNLVSISNHLLTFAENLWHSIIQTPFEKSSKKSSSSATVPTDSSLFHRKVAKNRKINFDETYQMDMKLDEIQYLLDRLENIVVNSQSDFLNDSFELVVKNCKDAIGRASTDDTAKLKISLKELLTPLLDSVKSNYPALQSNGNESDGTDMSTLEEDQPIFPCFMQLLYSSEKSYPQALALQNNGVLRSLEYSLGEVSSILFERCTRGFDMSAIWINYSRVVWAQPNTGQPSKNHGSKRGSWWPGVIVAGGGMSRIQEDINVSRIPKVIKTALNKLRPKSKDCTSQTGAYVGTDQLCLIEYFGNHDFGWCKTDVMEPYVEGHKFVLSDDKKESGYSDKVTADAYAIEEADSSFEAMESALSVDNFIPEEGFLEMLEESIDNLPIAIQYVAPGNSGDSKKRQSSSNGSKSTKTGSKRRKKSTDSLMDIPQNFTFTMYPSELEDLPCPGNKRYFALMKTVSLCRYAQAVNPLDVSHSFRGRSSFGQAGGNGEAVLHVNNAVSVAEAEALSHNIAMEEENAAVGMCFAGISNSANGDSLDQEKNGRLTISGAEKRLETAKDKTATKEGDGGEQEKKEPKYTPKVLAFAGQTFAAAIGCAQVVRNKSSTYVSVLHTRKIDHDNPIFFLEASSCEARKKLLQVEIKRLKGQLDTMSDWSAFADKINEKRQQDKQSRQDQQSRKSGHATSQAPTLKKTTKKGKGEKTGGFKKGLLQQGKSSAISGDTQKVKRKYVRKNKVGEAGASRGKAQQEDAINSNKVTVMSSSYKEPSTPETNGENGNASQKRKRSLSVEKSDVESSEEIEKVDVIKPVKVAKKAAAPKPFSGFTSVMNMMPSIDK